MGLLVGAAKSLLTYSCSWCTRTLKDEVAYL